MGTAAVTHLLRTTFRARWASYAGAALLLGVTVGLSLFAIAGARRTQSSYPSYLDSVDASTLGVGDASGYDPAENARVAALPEVVRSRTWVGVDVLVMDGPEGTDLDPDANPFLELTGTLDGQFFDQDRFRAIDGREPDPDAVGEVAVNELAAERFGYAVGQELTLGRYPAEAFQEPDFFTNPPPPDARDTVTIVGIGDFPDEIHQDEADRTPRLLLTPAFTREVQDYITFHLQALTLRHGDDDIAAVKNHLGETHPPGTLQFRVTSVDELHGLRATKPLSVALAVFGVVVGIAGLVLSGQALARLLRAERHEREVLRAFGTAPGTLVARALTGPTLAVLAGTALAVVLAVVASPAMPIGPIREVAGDPEIDVDVAVLGLGALSTVVVLLGVTGAMAWWDTRRRLGRAVSRTSRPSRLASVAGGLNPPAVMGLRLALQPSDGTDPVSSRSVVVGAAVAITGVVAALVFGASLSRVVDEPRLFGWDWDAVVLAGNGYGDIVEADADRILEEDDRVEAWAGATFGSDLLDDHETPLLGLAPGSDVVPPIVEGRAPANADETLLGPATAGLLGVGVGDTVVLGGDGQDHELEVVGLTILPTLGAVHAAHPSLGVGAVVDPELVPGSDLDITLQASDALGPNAILVRYRPGTDGDAQLARLRETTQPLATFAGIDTIGVQRPAEIVNSRSLGAVPALLATALVLGALTSLALSLGTSVRRRRRDFALVKTLGFTRRQLASTVAWDATATVVVGLLVGIPVGIAAGRFAWYRFADQLDVVAEPQLPTIGLGLVVVGALIVANVAAWVPARRARRVSASTALRSE